jgi:hypothetical protein
VEDGDGEGAQGGAGLHRQGLGLGIVRREKFRKRRV